jgi:hypothetical protein
MNNMMKVATAVKQTMTEFSEAGSEKRQNNNHYNE